MYRSPSCIHRVLLAAGLPILLSLTAMLSPAAPPTGDVPEASKIYVAPDGSDTAAGTRGAPLATLTAVRQKIRELKGRDRLPAGGVTVEMRGGRYEWTEPLELSAEDAGTAASPIVYRAFPGERVTIVGSRTINAWKPVTDPATLDRLAPGARGKVFQADLKALGVTEYGDLLHDAEWKTQYRHCLDDNQGEATQGDAVATRRLFRRTGEKIESRIEVFCDGYPMQLARWPNNGFTHIDKALGETKFDVRGLPGSREGIFSCVDDRPSRWTDEKDAMVRGYWFRDWVVQTQKIESIIPEKRIIKLAKPYHTYGGYRDGMWFFGFNLLCELDMPGEWYIDREADVLYFWPPRQMESALTEISVSDGLFRMVDTAHITLRGLRLEAARGTAVRIKDSRSCQVVGCSIRNVTNYGIIIVDGANCAVIGCDITRTGGGGVFMVGGDRKKLIPGGHYVENCHIHRFARWDRTYRPGILMTGAGLRASHNLIHHAPHSAIVYGGPLHRFEYNEIHNVCQESHDCGAIYGGRSWCMRGDLFLHNYLHHLSGKDGGACNGIYLDDANSGTTVRGNVFHQVRRPVFIGGGRDTLVEHNLFVDCPQAFHLDARYAPGNWAARYGDPRIEKAKKTGVLPPAVRFQEPPYSTRFPKLAKILDDEPTWPKGNILRENIFWRGSGENLRRTGWDTPPPSGSYRNAWWHHIQESAYKLLTIENNMVDVDPKLVDEEQGNFLLRDDSPAFARIGFKPIPFGKIGLYKDENRASWPVKHEITPLPSPPKKRAKKPKAVKKTLRKGPAPVFTVVRAVAPVTVDGNLLSAEWAGCDAEKGIQIDKSLYHEPVKLASLAWATYDGKNLYVGVRNDVVPDKPLVTGKKWARNDAVEIALRNPQAGKDSPIFVLRGYPDGTFQSSGEAKAPADVVEAAGKAVTFAAKVVDKGQWTAEYRNPLSLFGADQGSGLVLECNISVRKIADLSWSMWQGTGGWSWQADKAGLLHLP
mgnify:FL=1